MADPTNLSVVTATRPVELLGAPAVLSGHEDAGVVLLRPVTPVTTVRAA